MWNPYLIKDTVILERIQRQAPKFILRDYDNNYKTCLLKLDLLPLMHILHFYDIVFFIKALKQSSHYFIIHHYVSFSTINTRSISTNKLIHICTNNYTKNFFNRLPRILNKLPFIDLTSHYQPLKLPSTITCNNISGTTIHLTFHVRTYHALLL